MFRRLFFAICILSLSCNSDMLEKGTDALQDPRVPEINVKQGNDNILNESGRFSIDGVVVTETSAEFVFSIENLGTDDLNLTGVYLTGEDSAMFSIVSQPSSNVINPGRSETFSVTFTPDSVGEKTALVNIESDDFDESVYTFTLTGNPAPEPDFSARLRKGMIPLTVAFTDVSLGAITSLEWEFGDGAVLTTEPGVIVEHTYTVDGSYTVVLTATGPSGINYKIKSGYVAAVKIEKKVIDSYFEGARSVVAGDLDGDEDQDIAAAGFDHSQIAWYENNGSGSFAKNVIDSTLSKPVTVVIADIDGDGIDDVAAADGTGSDQVAWWKNDGSGNFGVKNTVVSANHINRITASNIDGSSGIDMICSSSYYTTGIPAIPVGEVSIFPNNGDGTFGAEITLKNLFYGVIQLAAADIDGDTDQDIIAVNDSNTSPLYWWENDGGWAADPGITIDGTEAADSVCIQDFSGDGIVDILSASPDSGLSDIDIWINSGDGTSWTKQGVATGYTGVSLVTAEDMNLDSKTDIIAGSLNYGISWWPADPEASLSYPVRHIVDNQFIPSSVAAADVDSNGYPDIIASSASSDEIAWWDLKYDGWYKTKVDSIFYEGDYASVADLDGDGDVDVIGSSKITGEISWWENEGYGNFVKKHVLDDSVSFDGAGPFYSSNSFAADIDGDGDMDILAAACYAREIVFWENLSGGSFGEQQVFTSYDSGEYTSSVVAADLDDDGDQDVITGALGKVDIWISAVSSGDTSWDQVPLDVESSSYVYNLAAADVDGDGDIDIIGTSIDENDNHVWWRNPLVGSNTGWERNAINTELHVSEARLADIDGDEDIDIICADSYDDLYIFQNNGSGVFSPVIIDSTGIIKTLMVSDIDGDADLDIIISPTNDNCFYTYRNNNNVFSAPEILTSAPRYASRIVDADIDNDGDVDILGIFSQNDEISVWENNIENYGE